jgi:hypothetical protein
VVNLSVIIITLNEEKNIIRCIESVKKVADEIIVVDSFSTDRTKEICLNYTQVKFYQRKWEGFGQTKNYAATLASGYFILSIDADEALSEKLASAILAEKGTLSGCYSFNRMTNYCGTWIRHGSWYPDKKIRIYPRNKFFWSEDLVHETLLRENATVKHLDGDLLHYSINNIKEHADIINKYSELAAQSALKKGKKASLLIIFFSPAFHFIKNYFIKFGFLDGYYGFIISKMSAHAKFLKYIKLKELQKSQIQK